MPLTAVLNWRRSLRPTWLPKLPPSHAELAGRNLNIAALLVCRSDPGALTIEQAHAAMQLHLDCTVDCCRVRHRARRTLVEAGRCVLDQRALPG